MYVTCIPRRQCVASERAVPYSPGVSPVEAAVVKIREGLAELADADMSLCTDDEVAAAALAVGAAASKLTAQETRLVGAVDRRDAYRADACVTAGGWLRLKTNLGHGPSARRVNRAKLLARMPLLEPPTSGAMSAPSMST